MTPSVLLTAASFTAESPAFATAHYHRQRILLARTAGSSMFTEITRARALLTRADGPSTRNAFTAQAMHAAPALGSFFENSIVEPAGAWGYEIAVKPFEKPTPGFYPEAAAVIADRLPLADLKLATRVTTLPRGARAHLAASTWVRAMLLGQTDTAGEVAPVATGTSRSSAEGVAVSHPISTFR